MRASETERGIICPASLSLPRPTSAPREKTVRARDLGTLIHHWKETGEIAPWGDPRSQELLWKKLQESGTRRETWWRGGEHEVAFAINLVTLETRRWETCPGCNESWREYGPDWCEKHDDPVPSKDEWKRGFNSDWLTGTIDYLYPGGGGDDLKCGDWDVKAEGNAQLKSYALLPWLEAGRPSDWEKLWSITQWKKYPLAGTPKRNATLITAFDLTEHLADLRWARENPTAVRVVDSVCGNCGGLGHSSWGCDYGHEPGHEDELSPCLFCPCRETHPASSWMTNWKYARLPACLPGLASVTTNEENE